MATACGFLFAYGMVEDLIHKWLTRRRTESVKARNLSAATKPDKILPINTMCGSRGYDSPELFRRDILLRTKGLERETNEHRRKIA